MKYRAVTSENFYFSEIKRACKFLLKNKDIEDMREEFKERDILDVTSPNNFKRKYLCVRKRLTYLTDELKEYLVNSDSQTGKVINLYTILCTERIILEFADEVIKEKYHTYDYLIYQKDFNRFIEFKADQSDIVKNWSEASKKIMVVKMKNFLTEGGLLTKLEEGKYKITRPIILPEIREEIHRNGEKEILKAMLY
ncbi:DUF1819 family protein [Psychrilyobacter sp.]|uniref:DUF1819 family protein n=1 Tax=Psychrilyobacter sp. TaxID=2586924 RepID=UPI0030159D77